MTPLFETITYSKDYIDVWKEKSRFKFLNVKIQKKILLLLNK